MKVLDFKCPECGGTRKAPEMALMLICEYCGACTVDHALGFFAGAGRRCSDRDLAEAIALLKPGYESDRGIGEFLAALDMRLRG